MTWQRSVFETMGTVVSFVFDARDEGPSDAVQTVLAGYDDRFSLYKPTSELSRIGRSELRLADASEEMLRMYSAALEWRVRTGGNFTPHRPDGIVDLSGIVKAQAMSDAGELLLEHGVSDWCLNVGGDVLVAGVDEEGEPWRVGIVDPDDRIELLTALPLLGTRRACATSGSAERGDHIWVFGEPATPFTQVTVVADDIVTADVLATAIIAGGQAELDRVCARYDVDVLSIDNAGELRAAPGVAQLVVAR